MDLNIGRLSCMTKKERIFDDVGEEILRILDETPALHLENREVSIRVPDSFCTFNAALSLNRQGIGSSKIRFPLDEIERISVHALGSPKFSRLDDSILKTPDEFQLSIEKIPEEVEGILLTFEYKVRDMSFLEDIVHTEVAAEPSKEADSYWMHAQLKHLKWFRDRYARWQLLDTPFHVEVAIENEVATPIPPHFKRHLKLLREVAREPDPHRIPTLSMMLASSRRRIRADPYNLISSLEGLFEESQFRRFVEVLPPFIYSHSKKGNEYLDFPTGVFPKTMSVTCCTKLDLETPASEGKLIYRKSALYKEISEIFGS
jgi:hypothetical protein